MSKVPNLTSAKQSNNTCPVLCCGVLQIVNMNGEAFNGSDEELIKLVEKFPQLYKKTDKSFKDKICKENGWKSIAAILNESAVQCERRFATLRNKYATIKRKMKGVPSGAGAADVQVSWPLYQLMGFLDTFIVPRRKHGSVRPGQGCDFGYENRAPDSVNNEDPEIESQDTEETNTFVEMDETEYQGQNIQSPASVYDSLNQIIVRPGCSSSNSPLPTSPSTTNVEVTHKEKTGLLRSAMIKKRKLSTTEDINLQKFSKITTAAMNNLSKYLEKEAAKCEENDVEKSFANTISMLLKKIKGKKRRKRAMKELINKALMYSSGSDTE